MNVSIHRPEKVNVKELEDSSTIAISITDDKGNDAYIFFNDYKTFINFSQIIRQGGTYGIEYNLKTGEKTL
jgi:hypothetical protein